MAKLSIKAGSTDVSVLVFVQNSSSTTGAGLTGLVYNSASLVAYYSHAGTNATATAISLATLAAVNSAHSDGGFKEISSTNMPGWYRFDLPDAVVAASKGNVVGVMLHGATNMAPCPLEIELTGWDNQDGVRGGMTALPNAAAGANGGLPLAVDSSGRVDVLKINGTNQTARDIGASVLLSSGTGSGQISLSSGAVTVGTNNDKTGYSLSQSFPTNFASLSIDGSGRVDVAKIAGTSQTARDIGASVLLSSGTGTGQISLSSGAVTVGTNNDKTGYALSQSFPTNFASLAITAAGKITVGTNDDKTGYSLTQSFPTNFASMAISGAGAVTAGTVSDKTGYSLSSAQTFDLTGSISGSVGSVTGNVGGNVVGSVASVVAAVDIDDTQVLTEAYASKGGTLTWAKALYGIHQHAVAISYSGTTGTVKRRDGSTTALTLTLDDAVTPTSVSQS